MRSKGQMLEEPQRLLITAVQVIDRHQHRSVRAEEPQRVEKLEQRATIAGRGRAQGAFYAVPLVAARG